MKYFINKLAPWKTSWESGSCSVNKKSTFYEILKIPLLVLVPSQIIPVHTPPCYFKNRFNIATYPGFGWLIRRVFDLMIEFTGPLYNLLQQFTNHYLRLDTLDFWPHFTTPLLRCTLSILIYQKSKSKLCYDRRSAGQSVLEQSTHLGLTTRSWLLSDSCGFVGLGRPLWREDGSVVCNCYWPSPAQSFSGPSPIGLVAIFYCLRFEISLFVASYNSQGHGGGIRPRLHTGFWSTTLFCITYIASRRTHRTHVRCLVIDVYCCSERESTNLLPSNWYPSSFELLCRGNEFTETLLSIEHMRHSIILPYKPKSFKLSLSFNAWCFWPIWGPQCHEYDSD
jgi:hypothetical protein